MTNVTISDAPTIATMEGLRETDNIVRRIEEGGRGR